MPHMYAIRITEANLDLVKVLSPFKAQPEVNKEYDTYFLFTVDSTETTTDHDIVDEDNLYGYDGHQSGQRTILM